MILIPQSLAYAEIAGLEPVHGLFAAAIPAVAAALVASSPYLQTGPIALVALLSYGVLASIAEPRTAEFASLAALLALIVGVAYLILAALRAGVIGYLMSRPVLIGFTSAAVILIISSQIPTALGTDAPDGELLYRAGWSLLHPGSWNLDSLWVTLMAMVVILGARRIHPLLPGVPIAAAIAIAAAQFGGFSGAQVGPLPAGMPSIGLNLPWDHLPDLLLPGFVIALVGFFETSSIARVYAAADRHRWEANRALAGQGLANVAASLSGGFPVSGSFSRTSINRLSGARTRWSSVVTGITVLAFLPFSSVLEPLPKSALAGLVIAAVASLVRPDRLLRPLRETPLMGLAGVATFVATLALAPRIDYAVLVGISLAAAAFLAQGESVDFDAAYADGLVTVTPTGLLVLRSGHDAAERLFAPVAAHPGTTRLVVELGAVGYINSHATEALEELRSLATDAGIAVEFVRGPRRYRRNAGPGPTR